MSYPCPLSPLRPSEAATPAEAEWISSLCRAVVPRLGGDLLVPAVRAVVWETVAREPARLEARLNALTEVAAAVAAGRYAAKWVGYDLLRWYSSFPRRVSIARVELPAVTTRYDKKQDRRILAPRAITRMYNIYLNVRRHSRPTAELLPIGGNRATIALIVSPTASPPMNLLEEVRARAAAAALEAALEEAGA
jgi:hypothetical protein